MEKIAPQLRQNILDLAAGYLKITGRSIRQVSRDCHSDPNFLVDLKAGKIGFGGVKYDSVVAWFETNWPEGHKFPRPKNPKH